MIPAPEITVKRLSKPGENIFVIGPGGVGKSTLGTNLARLGGYQLVDLDLEFCQRIAIIGPFIAQHGYEAYRAANLGLAQQLTSTMTRQTILVTSSGFLVAPRDSSDYRDALALIRTGYSIRLLPSPDLAAATDIVVTRQLARGFGLERETEIGKFQQRFDIYRDLGEMQVTSAALPEQIADAVMRALGPRTARTKARQSPGTRRNPPCP